ncbi:MAG: hypothetical protein R3C32_06485 [Chloroflexota bacterium]
MDAGRAFGIRPAGMLALDVCASRRGSSLLEVDYTSSAHALVPEQSYSPYELGLGRLVDLDKEVPFVGRAALRREVAAGGPARRLVGLDLDWGDLERLYAAQDLTPALSPAAWRQQVPVYAAIAAVGRYERHVESRVAPTSRLPRSRRATSRWAPRSRWNGRSRAARPRRRDRGQASFFDPPHKRA